MPLENLIRARIIGALNLLGLRAQQEGVELELCIYGGSAMMLAYSSGDIEDIRFLIRKMEIRSLPQVEELLGRFYPYDALTPQARALIEGLLPRPESPAP